MRPDKNIFPKKAFYILHNELINQLFNFYDGGQKFYRHADMDHHHRIRDCTCIYRLQSLLGNRRGGRGGD